MSTARQIDLLAAALDEQGKPDVAIDVVGTRAHLLRDFKPRKRGGGAVRSWSRTADNVARQARVAGQLRLAGGAA